MSLMKAIRPDPVFIVACGGDERRLPLVTFPDSNEVVRTPQVQFGEYAGSTEFLQGGWDQGKWIRQLHRLRIQHAIVDTGPQAPVLLTHKNKLEAAGEVDGWINPC